MLPNKSVFIMRDDTEAVGDGLRGPLPFPGKCFVEKVHDRLGELPEIWTEPVVRHIPVHDAPQSLNRVQMGVVGRQEMQPDAAVRPCRERFGFFAW